MRYVFTARGRQAVLAAYQAAYDRQCDYIGPEHLLLGLIAIGDDAVDALLLWLGADVASIRRQIDAIVGPSADKPRYMHLPQTPALRTVFERSAEAGQARASAAIDADDLLRELLATPSAATEVLARCGVNSAGAAERLDRPEAT